MAEDRASLAYHYNSAAAPGVVSIQLDERV